MNSGHTFSRSSPMALVVDDSPFSRKKICKALHALDVDNEYAADGQEALTRIRQGGIDLILLDLNMPNVDGYEVLSALSEDQNLKEIPVLVISSVDSRDEIARSLALGAVDFLPKDVDPIIFKTRVLGSLDKKRVRDVELAYMEDVERLAEAANQIRTGEFVVQNPDLKLVEARQDRLGNLARVFSELAAAVHKREMAARARINLVQGSLLLLIMGLSWGALPALSKILIGPASLEPIGVAAWVALVTLSIVSVIMLVRGIKPKFTWPAIRFGLIAGLFAGVLPQTVVFWVSSQVPGVVLSITLALESLIVFAIAATLRLERPSLIRLTGLLLGLLAVVVIMLTSDQAAGLGAPIWVLAAAIVPFSYAVESILVAMYPDDGNTTPIEFLFFIMVGSSIWGWVGATLTGVVINPFTAEKATVILIATIGLMSAISNGCYVLAIRKMGAVFASQYAYLVTILGVGWSVLLLGERLTIWVWIALGCVLAGTFLVRPKEDSAKLTSLLTSSENEQLNTDPLEY